MLSAEIMKTSINSEETATRKSKKGFSLLELLIVVAVLSSVASAGYLLMSGLTTTVQAGKLQSDTVTLNNAVRTYLTNGGSIPGSADAPEVLARLKTTSDGPTRQRLAGIRGSMLDARLRGILTAQPGADRAVWDPAKQRFELKTAGVGFSAFDLGADPAAQVVEERRSRTMDLAARDHWVWDFRDGSTPRATPSAIPVKAVANITPPVPAPITRLAPPDFSMPGTLYDFSAFNPNLSVSLVDRNAPGQSRLFYSIDGGPWIQYSGRPLNIPPQFTTTVRAYAAAVNGEYFEDSDQRTEKYETIFFTGSSSGKFHSPLGDARLLTNLLGGLKLPTFKWGDPATPDKKQNELNFTGAQFENVPPDKEFVLGTLSYYNGTTWASTNATSVQIAIDLDLTKPGVKESLNFTFKLQSTPNQGKSADADADYVYIPDVSTNFRTIIKGQTFALILRFGEHSPSGFTTIDTFHAHESKTLRGTIYGRLTAVN